MPKKPEEIILSFDKLDDPNAAPDAPVPARVKYQDSETETFEFTSPLGEPEFTKIHWYLELYPVWPAEESLDTAREIEAELPRWGRALFDAVFKQSPDAMRLYERFDGQRGPGALLTIDTVEPRILRLPWELLADEGGHIFCNDPAITVRRRLHRIVKARTRPFKLPVRILMVVSRPEGAGFIDPRSIAQPILNALQDLGDQVIVEFLRPPTLQALTRRLRNKRLEPVHVVHFDGHGVYDSDVGLGFLLFEDSKYKKDLVDAEQLGALLQKCGVPLAVLNACQSAQPDEINPFGSVAARLIEAGVSGVVAMNYSVLVPTAALLTQHFYTALARGEAAGVALDEARYELLADTSRFTFHRPGQPEAEVFHLKDWFLPALYQQAEELRPFPKRESDQLPVISDQLAQARQPVLYGFPPEPLHGFHGRARELLALERLFAKRPIVVLHGFGGQGKTALAAHAASWLTRTRLFERAAFISFESGVGLDYVTDALGNALVGENFQIYDGDKNAAIAQALKEVPTLVVWDNFESVLPGGNAPLAGEALGALLEAGEAWFKQLSVISNQSSVGRSALLVTTRDPSLPNEAFQPGVGCAQFGLEGLLLTDALDLAATILEAHSLARPPREGLERLLDYLGGHPLSIQLVLPQLKQTPDVEQLIAEFERLLPGFTQGEGRARNQSLEVSLRFSLARLGQAAQALLPRLAVFDGGAVENMLLTITEIPEAEWAALKPALANAALIRVEELPGVSVPYLHFHPTLAPYLARGLEAGARGALEERYWQAYYRFAGYLYQTDFQHPIPARALAGRELPNLRRALRLALQAGALDEAVGFADSINRFLDNFGRWRERDEVAAEVERAVREGERGSGGEGDGKLTKAEFLMESGRGERLWQGGRAAEAEQLFRRLLGRLEGGAAYEAGYYRMLTQQRLGRCLEAQGRPTQAAEQYREALKLAQELEQTDTVRRAAGGLHADLADVLSALGQYAAARKEYEAALEIAKGTDDERQVGVVLNQLGTLALRQGELAEARRRCQEALQTFAGLGEQQSEAIAWHQLGMVAQEGRDWEDAERCYKESLALRERLGDLAGAAQTCNQLARVAAGAGRPEEAERWYGRALEGLQATGQMHYAAVAASNLANLLLAQPGRLEEAERYARQALAIKETLDLSAEPWKTYNILAQIAEKRGQAEQARGWRRKEQESFAAFKGSEHEIRQWLPVIGAVVAACQGNEQAAKDLAPFLQQMGETQDWRNLIAVIRRILNGERDGDGLTDGLDRIDGLIVQRILAGLETSPPAPSPEAGEGEPPSPNPVPTPGARDEAPATRPAPAPEAGGERQGVTLPQLLELVERAAGGDRELGGQLFGAFQQMRADPNAPPELQALADALLRVLIGDMQPDLDALPPELASYVRGMLGRLKARG